MFSLKAVSLFCDKIRHVVSSPQSLLFSCTPKSNNEIFSSPFKNIFDTHYLLVQVHGKRLFCADGVDREWAGCFSSIFYFNKINLMIFFSVSAKCSYMKNRCVSSGSANIYSVVRIIEGVKNFNIIFCELPFSAAVGQNLYLMHISEIFNAKKWEFLSYIHTSEYTSHIRRFDQLCDQKSSTINFHSLFCRVGFSKKKNTHTRKYWKGSASWGKTLLRLN